MRPNNEKKVDKDEKQMGKIKKKVVLLHLLIYDNEQHQLCKRSRSIMSRYR